MRFVRFSILGLALPLFAVDEALISALRMEKFDAQTESILQKSFTQRYQWLSPLQLSYSVQRLSEPQQTLKNFVVSIDQPVFKSGGISAQMRLGEAQERLSLLQLSTNKNESLHTVVDTAFALRKNSLLRQKQAFLVENASIDVDRKKALYLAGLTDGSFLDNAMLAKNGQQLTLLELEQDAKRLDAKLKAYSDADLNSLQLPTFSIKSEDEYLQKSLTTAIAKADEQRAAEAKRVTLSAYLPALFVYGSYTDTKVSPSNLSYQNSDSGAVGFRLSLSLDPKSKSSYESARLDELVAKKRVQEAQLEERALVQDSLSKLESLRLKISLAKSDESSYASLYEQSEAMMKAGLKTLDDVTVLGNSKKVKSIEAQIYAIERQMELSTLYFRGEK